MPEVTNWAENLAYSTHQIHFPETLAEIQTLVADCQKVRVVGSRHSFNRIADSTHNLLSLQKLPHLFQLDPEHQTVTVGGGMTYSQLCDELAQGGYALHNLASLTDISIGGACATATHGSGDFNGNLATAVAGIEMVTAQGDLLTLSCDDADFKGAVVGLGGMGVVTKLILEVQPAFKMQQDVYLNLPMAQVERNFEAIMSSGYSVSLFTTWRTDTFEQVFLKRRIEEAITSEAVFFEAIRAEVDCHPIPGASVENCTVQRGLSGAWYERLPHFRSGAIPSFGAELQSEYFVPREEAVAALLAIRQIQEQIAPYLLISEIRTIAADDLWMSPCFKQDCVGLHFTWQRHQPQIEKLLPWLEKQLLPFKARPHWGKLFTMPSERLGQVYPQRIPFRELLATYDPRGKFQNAFLEAYLWD